MGGLLGAGLFGLLSGSGLFAGLTGLASVLGLLLEIALIGGAVWLVVNYFRQRSQLALARAPATQPILFAGSDRRFSVSEVQGQPTI